ncbi:hypothetical protein GCM10025868_46830 [Angustibacter aerolatus]|uniref:Tetratricopeptide repeat protein n=1 Tax=Angustibacter aerolatus TaxID=1162965 RepID=A0ABQ6JPX3_9ACTN|nr:hypothetical protein GCM10025868_46830 [Angustibacter aerolatus]
MAALNLGLLREKQGDPAAAAAAYRLAIDFGQAGVGFRSSSVQPRGTAKEAGDFAAAAAAYRLATNAGEPPLSKCCRRSRGTPP